jgi:transposase
MDSKNRTKNFLIFSETERRSLRGDRTIRRVFYNYIPVAFFYDNDLTSKKLAAIQLVSTGLATNIEAGEVVGLHRNTVSNAVNTNQLLGLNAVIKDDRGRKKPIYYTPEKRKHIIELLESKPGDTDEKIAQQASEELGTKISRQAVARIRVEHAEPFNGFSPPSKRELMEIEAATRRIEKRLGKQVQLSFNFENKPELKDDIEKISDEPSFEAPGTTQENTLSQLKKGIATPYAGLLFYQLFLGELNFSELFTDFKPPEKKQYSFEAICLSIFFGLVHGLSSIEAQKLVNPSQFGPIFGLPRSPDPVTIRTYLEIMAEQYISDSIIDKFALQVLKIGAVDPDVFFVDGHFLPYYGLNLLAKGWHTVRCQALKGNEIYVVSDIQKRPLMFITEGCEIDFRPIIHRLAAKIIDYGIKRPILVFDRGAYGVHFFSELSQYADFVTWGKYVRKEELMSVRQEDFTVGLRVNGRCYEISQLDKTLTESAGTAKKEERLERSSVNLRMVVIKEINEKTGKEKGRRLSVLTCDKKRPSWEIAYFMLNRWGKSENFFKEIMSIFNFNYQPGYVIDEMEQQPFFDNPEVAIIRSAVKSIKKGIEKIEGDKAILQLEYQNTGKQKTANKIDALEKKTREKLEDMAGFEKKLEELPEKITLESLLGKPMSKCDLEKKRIYDLLQIIAYHARERLVQELRHEYNRPHDVKQILDKITGKGGYVKLIGQTLVVLVDWIERPAHLQAAQGLCRRINNLGVKIQGSLSIKLHFAISRTPLIGVN